MPSHRLFLLSAISLLAGARLSAQQPTPPAPTHTNVPYGKHAKQVLDFYQAKAADGGVTPLLFFVHGGGWMTGDKVNPDFLKQCLDDGISVVSVNYRFIPDVQAEGITPPVKGCLDDCARALQFVRSKAAEWHFDKNRVGGCGGSAGGFTALWLGFSPEMADAKSADPIAHESTRLSCVLAFVPQTSLDPKQMLAWIPNLQYGNHAFGLGSMQEFLEKRESLMPWIERFSPYALASADDPPVLLFYDSAADLGKPPAKDPVHSGNFGAGIADKLKAVGIEHEINYNNDYGHMKYPNLFSFLKEKLGK